MSISGGQTFLKNSPKDHAEGKDLKQDRGADGQVLLLAGHGERGQGERPIVEGQLEGHVDRVEEYLFADELDLELLVVKVPGHFPDLAHRVVDETPPFASVMQSQSYRISLSFWSE